MKYDGSIRSFILLFCHAQVGGKDEREIGGQDVSSMGTITQIFWSHLIVKNLVTYPLTSSKGGGKCDLTLGDVTC